MKNLTRAIVLLLATVIYGVVGYVVIDDSSVFDAFYMTVITISTVGYEESMPISTAGRVHTMVLISFGIMIGGYTIGTFLRMFIEGELKKSLGRRKVEKKIAELENHYIICGYGRIGSLISEELGKHGMDYVIIENDPERVEGLDLEKKLNLPMDATMDETLEKAGIHRAAGLVTAVRSDADNVFITLTAKGLRPDVFVLARSSDEKSESKLKRAGATRVVSPYLIGGSRMAHVLIRPTVVDFIDIAIMESSLGLMMEEVIIEESSYLNGKNLIESELRKNFGVIIVLIKKNNGEMKFNPAATEILHANDVLVVLGQKDNMKKMVDSI